MVRTSGSQPGNMGSIPIRAAMNERLQTPSQLIEAGMLKGREALEFLDARGDYIYHGSPLKIEKLEPRQAHQFNAQTGERIPDEEPAVAAADNYEMAIFIAVLNKKYGSKGDWSGFGRKMNQKNELEDYFRSTQHLLDNAREQRAIGYVHVFEKKEFVQFRDFEYRSKNEVAPIYIVEVGIEDLPKNIKIVEPSKN